MKNNYVINISPSVIDVIKQITEWENKRYKINIEVSVDSISNEFTTIRFENLDKMSLLFDIGLQLGHKNEKEYNDAKFPFVRSDITEPLFSLKIMSGDEKVIVDTLIKFNRHFNTEITIKEFDYDEIIFATLNFSKSSVSDIFYLGYFFGEDIKKKRSNKEIDW